MRAYDFLVTEAVKASDIRRGQSGVKIGFEFEILIPQNSVQSSSPQYTPNDQSWMAGKTVKDMINKMVATNNEFWSGKISNLFKINRNHMAAHGGTSDIAKAYTNWSRDRIEERKNDMAGRTTTMFEAVKKAIEKLRDLPSNIVSPDDVRESVTRFFNEVENGPDGINLRNMLQRANPPVFDENQLERVRLALHGEWIVTGRHIDQIWLEAKNSIDPSDQYRLDGLNNSIGMQNFLDWVQSSFGTTEISQLLRKKWSLKTSTTKPKEELLRNIWFWVTPDARSPTSSTSSYNS